MTELADARYISLTTFTRAGVPKPTPVWITGSDGIYYFYTGADSWKVKRLRNNPTVEIHVCDMRGRVDPHTTVHHGTGQVLDDSRSLNDVKDAVLRKYGWQARMVRLTDAIKERLGSGEDPIAVRIVIEPQSLLD